VYSNELPGLALANYAATQASADAAAASADSAALSASLVGAPADTAVAAIVGNPASATSVSLSATYASRILPAYAGARVHTWNPELSLYNGESPALRKARNLITKGRAGTALRIVCAGDSKTTGSGVQLPDTMANESYPAQLAALIGARPGLIIGNPIDKRWSAATGFLIPATPSQNYWDGGTAGTNTVTLTTDQPHTGFIAYGYTNVGGPATVTVDGVAQTWTIASGGSWGVRTLTVTGLANTTHVITVAADGALNMSFLGIEPTYSTTGIVVCNAGRSSSTAADWLPQNWSTLYASSISGSGIPLPGIVLLGIGTNTGTSTLADIGTVAANINALGIPLVLIVPGGLGGVNPSSSYDAKRDAIYDAADSLNVPLVDFTHLIGDFDVANPAGLMGDTIHESSAGNAIEAACLARILTF